MNINSLANCKNKFYQNYLWGKLPSVKECGLHEIYVGTQVQFNPIRFIECECNIFWLINTELINNKVLNNVVHCVLHSNYMSNVNTLLSRSLENPTKLP